MAGIGYAFISAYLKGEEARIITQDHLNAVMRASGYQDAVDTIRDSNIGIFLEGLEIQNFEELDEQLWIYLNGCMKRIEWFKSVPKPARQLVAAYAVKYDVQNIKTALQNIITGEKTRGIPAGDIYNEGLLEELMNAENLDGILSVLNSCNLADYANVIEPYRTDESINKEVLTDTGLESLYFSKLLASVKKSKDSTALSRIFMGIIDLTNLQIVLRAVMGNSDTVASGKTVEGGYLLSGNLIRELLTLKTNDLPSRIDQASLRTIVDEIIANFEKDGNISVIDETIDKYKLTLMSENIAPRIMSPVVVIWYLFLKEIEVRNVRLVLKAALDNIPPEEIRNYLVYAS